MPNLKIFVTFCAEERLKNRKSIEALFKSGHSVNHSPVKVLWLFSATKNKYPAKAGFAVPKKNMKSSVHRNRTKRFMREIYRKNKDRLYDALASQNKNIDLMIIFTGNKPYDRVTAGNKIISAINRLIEDVTGMN